MGFDQIVGSEKFITFVVPGGIFLITLILGLVLRKFVLIKLAHFAKNTRTEIDDIIMAAISKPFIIWCVMLALYVAMDISKLPQSFVVLAGKVLLILGIMSVALTLADIVVGMIKTYSAKLSGTMPTTSLIGNVARIIIFCIGILISLNSLGISITPILATLGVGGLAVALALQDTLANLFAGFYVIINNQIRAGDYIKLENGQEGYVIDINWRVTKIRALSDSIIIVPNVKLTQAIVLNFHMPNKEIAVPVNLSVHYNSDLEFVEKITLEVAKDVMSKVKGGVKNFDPSLKYNNFGDSGIGFTVGLRANEYADQYQLKHEFIKRLHARYKKEGIVIPYPIRAINYSQEKGDNLVPKAVD